MIDSDFCTDPVSYDEEALSDGLRERRNKVGMGKEVNMGLGYKWRSTDVSCDLQ